MSSNSPTHHVARMTVGRIASGFQAGFKTKDGSFFEVLAVALMFQPGVFALACAMTTQTLGWEYFRQLSTVVWITTPFCVYLAVVASLQSYHRQQDDSMAIEALARQVDWVAVSMVGGLLIWATVWP